MSRWKLSPVQVPEVDEALAFWRCVQVHVRRYPELRMLHHIPNGEARTIQAGARLRATGVRPGVVDYLLDWPREQYLGLRLELKAKGGTLRPLQAAWGDCYDALGYCHHVAEGWEAAWEITEGYLRLGLPDGMSLQMVDHAREMLARLAAAQDDYEVQRLARLRKKKLKNRDVV